MRMSFLNRLLSRGAPRVELLRPYERAVVNSLKPVLSLRAWTALQEQTRSVASVQRLAGGKEVNLFYDRTLTLASSLAPSPFETWPIAVVHCRAIHSIRGIRASVWIAQGKIASIVFNDFPVAAGIDELAGMHAQVVFDPFAVDGVQESDARQPDSIALHLEQAPPEIIELARRVGEPAMRPPLSPRYQSQLLVPAQDCLPHDCAELLRYTNGLQLNGWNFAGLPLQEVAMEGANLFVLADADAPYVLCAKDGDAMRNIYHFDLEDHRERCVGNSFLKSLEIDSRGSE